MPEINLKLKAKRASTGLESARAKLVNEGFEVLNGDYLTVKPNSSKKYLIETWFNSLLLREIRLTTQPEYYQIEFSFSPLAISITVATYIALFSMAVLEGTILKSQIVTCLILVLISIVIAGTIILFALTSTFKRYVKNRN